MVRFLIDVNLPYFFGLWNNDSFLHQIDLDKKATDSNIWEYAIKNNLTIITKDSDFSSRILLSNPPPKVIHIKIRNTSMKEFHRIIHSHWSSILEMNQNYKLVNVYKNKIEGIR